MSHIEMKLTDESLEELCQGGPAHGPKLARLITEDINEFEKWMASSLAGPEQGPLSRFEKAILQTFAYWKLTKGRKVSELPRVKVAAEALPGASSFPL